MRKKTDNQDNYTVRLPIELKADFLAAARSNDRDGAQLVREFMRGYVKANPVEPMAKER